MMNQLKTASKCILGAKEDRLFDAGDFYLIFTEERSENGQEEKPLHDMVYLSFIIQWGGISA